MANQRFNARKQFPTAPSNVPHVFVSDETDANQYKQVPLADITNPLKGVLVTHEEQVLTQGEIDSDLAPRSLARPAANYEPSLTLISVNGKFAISAVRTDGADDTALAQGERIGTAAQFPVRISSIADEASTGDNLQVTTFWKFVAPTVNVQSPN